MTWAHEEERVEEVNVSLREQPTATATATAISNQQSAISNSSNQQSAISNQQSAISNQQQQQQQQQHHGPPTTSSCRPKLSTSSSVAGRLANVVSPARAVANGSSPSTYCMTRTTTPTKTMLVEASERSVDEHPICAGYETIQIVTGAFSVGTQLAQLDGQQRVSFLYPNPAVPAPSALTTVGTPASHEQSKSHKQSPGALPTHRNRELNAALSKGELGHEHPPRPRHNLPMRGTRRYAIDFFFKQ